MTIVCSELYEKQLKKILEDLMLNDIKSAKDFKMYLDTLIINAPTKSKKYKKSIFFDDENIKDIEYNGYKIPFLEENNANSFIILGIIDTNNIKDSVS